MAAHLVEDRAQRGPFRRRRRERAPDELPPVELALAANVCKNRGVLRLLVAAVVALLPQRRRPRGRTGMPAGDVLIQQNVFYGSELDLRSKEAAQLMALTEQAKEKGYEMRVAALTVPEDLGAINYLWDDPTNYADFLTAEIQSVLPRAHAGRDAERAGDLVARARVRGRAGDPGRTRRAGRAPDGGHAAGDGRDGRRSPPRRTSSSRSRMSNRAPGGVKQPASHFQQTQGRVRAGRSGSGRRERVAVRAPGPVRGSRGGRRSSFDGRLSSSA